MRRFTLANQGLKPLTQVRRIFLKMDSKASLNWKEEAAVARKYVAEGFSLLWEFETGLFEKLECPLSDEGQFLSFQLAFAHFRDHLYPEFEKETQGAILYRGSADFSHSHQKFCDKPSMSECLDYLLNLLAELPETLVPYLALEPFSEKEIFKLISQEGCEHFQLILEGEFPYEQKKVSVGLLLPGKEEGWEELEKCLGEMQHPFRAIPERLLTQEWDGIDTLVVVSKGVSTQGRRKILGFCAAGGSIFTFGEPLGVPGEVLFHRFYNKVSI